MNASISAAMRHLRHHRLARACLAMAFMLSAHTALRLDAHAAEPQAYDEANPATIPTDRLDVPWWAQRHQAVLQRVRQGHVDLIFLGDSITQRLSDPRLQRVWDWYYGNRNALNLGFAGDTTANVLWRLNNGEIEGLAPKLVVLMIGVNNTGHMHQDAQQVEGGIEAVISDLETRLPHTRILLLAILPTGRPQLLDVTDRPVNAQLARRYQGDKRVTFLDVGSTLMRGGQVDPQFFADRVQVHPDIVGQNRICMAIEPTLSRLLGDTPKPPLQ